MLSGPYVVWTNGRRATEMGLSFGFDILPAGLRARLDIIIFLESGLEELQLIMEVFVVTQSPGCGHQV
jgi:hypothetical protein